MVALHWCAVAPATGEVVAELPGAFLEDSLTRSLGKGYGCTLNLPITDRLPPQWQEVTEPNRIVLVCYYDDPEQTILWAGRITSRQYGSGELITLGADSIENIMQSRFLFDLSFSQVDQCEIAAELGLRDMCNGSEHPTYRIGAGGLMHVIPSGVKRDRNYARIDTKSQLGALQDLMRVQGGCEWAFDYTWTNDGKFVVNATAAQKIGRGRPQFALSGASWTLTQDYTVGRGAPIVGAWTQRMGDTRLFYTAGADDLLANGWIYTAYNFEPDSGSVKVVQNADGTQSFGGDAQKVLEQYAEARLADIKYGTTTYAISALLDQIVVGRDVRQGDMITLDLDNPDLPGAARSMDVRFVGWTIQPDGTSGEVKQIAPILMDSDYWDDAVDDGDDEDGDS